MTAETHQQLNEWGATPPAWLNQRTLAGIAEVCALVADAFGITPDALFMRRRGIDQISHARQLAMAILREGKKLPLQTIGQTFGGRDHGTVCHACNAVRDRREMDEDLESLYQSQMPAAKPKITVSK